MSVIDALPIPQQRAKSGLLIEFFAKMVFVLSFAAVASLYLQGEDPAQKCQIHKGGFSSDFSSDFDKDRIKCHSTSKTAAVIDGLRSFLANGALL